MHEYIKYYMVGDKIVSGYPIEKMVPSENGENDNDIEFISNLPSDINEFKTNMVATLNWYMGSLIRNKLDNDISKLSAASFKSTALLYKIIANNNLKLDGLTDKEKTIFNTISDMANNGYSDSDLLVNVLSDINSTSDIITTAINKIIASNDFNEIIDIVNNVID